jgi:hypothetical protein
LSRLRWRAHFVVVPRVEGTLQNLGYQRAWRRGEATG